MKTCLSKQHLTEEKTKIGQGFKSTYALFVPGFQYVHHELSNCRLDCGGDCDAYKLCLCNNW